MNSETTYRPLSGGDQTKTLLFISLIALSCFFIAGILPALFLVFGAIQLKRNNDLSALFSAIRFTKWYIYFGLIISLGYAIIYYFEWSEKGHSGDKSVAILFGILAGALFLLTHLLNFLIETPARCHRMWIEKNGFFASREKSERAPIPAGINIMDGAIGSRYSVADELIKWAKLRDDGVITEAEFQDARKKLLE